MDEDPKPIVKNLVIPCLIKVVKLPCSRVVSLDESAAGNARIIQPTGRHLRAVVRYLGPDPACATIEVATKTQVLCSRLELKSITDVFSGHIEQGMMSIRWPSVCLMIKDAPVKEMKLLYSCIQSRKDKCAVTQDKVPATQAGRKRPRSINLTADEDQRVIKKIIDSRFKRKHVISSRAQYFESLPSNIEDLRVNNISLKRIDDRLLVLEKLSKLDLSNNRIHNIDALLNRVLPLETLNLADNQINKLSQKLPCVLRYLKTLNLRGNKLEFLPESLGLASYLEHLDVSYNRIKCLPYCLGTATALRVLLVNNNDLRFLPGSFTMSFGFYLTRLDVTQNHPEIFSASLPNFNPTSPLTEISLYMLSAQAFVTSTYYKYFRQLRTVLPKTISNDLQMARVCQRCGKRLLQFKYSTKLVDTSDLRSSEVRIEQRRLRVSCATCLHDNCRSKSKKSL